MSLTRRVAGVVIFSLIALILAACGGGDEPPQAEPTLAPQALLQDSATQIENATSFELELNVDGYPVEIQPQGLELPEGFPLEFKYAQGVYQAPDRINARIQFSVGDVSTTAELIAIGLQHYFRGELLTANQWINAELIQGFSPESLMSEDSGIPSVLDSIQGLQMAEQTDIDGVPMNHLTGTIGANDVHSLTFGLIRTEEGQLPIDVYLSVDDNQIGQIVFQEPPPPDAADAPPTTWTIAITDYNEDVSITPPDVSAAE